MMRRTTTGAISHDHEQFLSRLARHHCGERSLSPSRHDWPLHARTAAGVQVYDVGNKESFQNVKSWFTEVNRYAADNVAVMMVGNKSDTAARQVSAKSDARPASQPTQRFLHRSPRPRRRCGRRRLAGEALLDALRVARRSREPRENVSLS